MRSRMIQRPFRRRSRVAVGLAAIALVLLAAGCGNDDDASADAPEDGIPATEQPEMPLTPDDGEGDDAGSSTADGMRLGGIGGEDVPPIAAGSFEIPADVCDRVDDALGDALDDYFTPLFAAVDVTRVTDPVLPFAVCLFDLAVHQIGSTVHVELLTTIQHPADPGQFEARQEALAPEHWVPVVGLGQRAALLDVVVGPDSDPVEMFEATTLTLLVEYSDSVLTHVTASGDLQGASVDPDMLSHVHATVVYPLLHSLTS